MPSNDFSALPLHTTCDVAVIGYGPVGMVCAALLAEQGIKVVVVEKHQSRYALSRAGHIDGETMRVLQRLGVADEFELIARAARSFDMVTTNHTTLQNLLIGTDNAGWRSNYLFYQPQLESILNVRADELGVNVFMGTKAVALEQDAEHALLTVASSTTASSSEARTIKASFVIGADGAESSIRSILGLRKRDLGFPALQNLVVDFEHYNPDADFPLLQENYQVLDTSRPQGAGRWKGGRWSRFEFTRNQGETYEQLESEGTVWKILSKWGITPSDGRVDRKSVYTFSSTMTVQWRTGRVFLVGDAAHTMPPFLGQGMCSGLRDAMNLSWKMTAVLKGEASEKLLNTYELERSAHVEQVTRLSMSLGKTLITRNPVMGWIRYLALWFINLPPPPPLPRLTGPLLQRLQSTNDFDPTGRPSLQGRVALGKLVDRLDTLTKPGWKLVCRHAVPVNLFDEHKKAFMATIQVQVLHVTRGDVSGAYIDIDGDYDLWFRKHGKKAFLQRPDNYVFGTAETVDDVPHLIDELELILTAAGWREPTFGHERKI